MNCNSLLAGIGRVDVTPEMGTRLGGYGIKERPAENVIDPLNSTALYLERDGKRTVIVNLDWICVDAEDAESVRAEVERKLEIPADNVIICGTHSHSTPNTLNAWGWGEKEREYIASTIPKVVESVVKAFENRKAVKVGINTTKTEVGINRRWIGENHGPAHMLGDPLQMIDPTMTVIRFETEDGPVGSLIHCGAHGTAMGVTRDVSRDWPGVMLDRYESQMKAPALFINGAIGDVGPRTSYLRNPNGFSAGTGDGRMSVLEVGLRGAADALRAAYKIRDWRGDFDLDLITENILLKYAPLEGRDSVQAQLMELEPRKNDWGHHMAMYNYCSAVLQAHKKPMPAGFDFRQTIIRLGPIAFVPMPGETFSLISNRLRAYSPFAHTLCASVTNGSLGYLCSREARARGGYEPWVGKAYSPYLLADNIDDIIVEENLRLLRKQVNG